MSVFLSSDFVDEGLVCDYDPHLPFSLALHVQLIPVLCRRSSTRNAFSRDGE